MLGDTGGCWGMLEDAEGCLGMLGDAGGCWGILQREHSLNILGLVTSGTELAVLPGTGYFPVMN